MEIRIRSIRDYAEQQAQDLAATFMVETFFFPLNNDYYRGYDIENLLTSSDYLCYEPEVKEDLLSDFCRVGRAIVDIYNMNAQVSFLSACRTIIRENEIPREDAIKFVEKAAHHAKQFKSTKGLIALTDNVYGASPTSFLKKLVGGKKKRYARSRHSWDSRSEKNLTRALVCEETMSFIDGYSYADTGEQCFTIDSGKYKRHCLLMPGSSALDLDQLLAYKHIIDLDETSIILIEKDRREASALLKNLSYPIRDFEEGDEDPGLKLFIGDFKDLPLMKCDLAWFDMMGNINRDQAWWLQNMLFSSYEEGESSNLWFTFSLVPRSGEFLKEARHALSDREKRRISRLIAWGDYFNSRARKNNIMLFIFILQQIFKHYDFNIDIFPYKDSATHMALIHLNFLTLRKVARPNLLF